MLRKKHDKHDIVRKNSFTHPKYIGAALRTSAHTTRTVTNDILHRRHQFNVYSEILTSKGYSKDDILKAFSKKAKKKKPKSIKNKFSKSYGGKVTFDGLTGIDNKIKRLLFISKLPTQFSLPISVGGKKLKSYVFTKKKFYKKFLR